DRDRRCLPLPGPAEQLSGRTQDQRRRNDRSSRHRQRHFSPGPPTGRPFLHSMIGVDSRPKMYVLGRPTLRPNAISVTALKERVATSAAACALVGLAFVSTVGCAQKDWIDRTLVTVDVTGVWEGKQDFGPGGGGARDIVIVLQQQGAKVTGEIRNSATALGS